MNTKKNNAVNYVVLFVTVGFLAYATTFLLLFYSFEKEYAPNKLFEGKIISIWDGGGFVLLHSSPYNFQKNIKTLFYLAENNNEIESVQNMLGRKVVVRGRFSEGKIIAEKIIFDE